MLYSHCKIEYILGCLMKKMHLLQRKAEVCFNFVVFYLKIITMIRQCAVLFGCLALGELVVFLTGIKLPSSIIGMLLLALFLKLGWIKLKWVQGLSDFLVSNLGFFFVPPGVALMLYFDVIKAEFWPIVIATLVSTILVLIVTGWVHQIVRKLNGSVGK